jgi:hypothetical protein
MADPKTSRFPHKERLTCQGLRPRRVRQALAITRLTVESAAFSRRTPQADAVSSMDIVCVPNVVFATQRMIAIA